MKMTLVWNFSREYESWNEHNPHINIFCTDHNGTPYATMSPKHGDHMAKVYKEDDGCLYLKTKRDGLYASMVGDWVVFRPANEAKYCSITTNSNNYAMIAGYWLCVDGDGWLNTKRAGSWVLLNEVTYG